MAESEGNNGTVKTFKTQDGITIYLENFREINPAQDFAEGIAFITQTLWYDRPLFDSRGNFLSTVKDKAPFVITSDKRIIKLESGRNQFQNLLMTVPDTAPDNRFSTKTIEKFLTGDIDFNPHDLLKQITDEYRKYLDMDNIPGAYTVNAIYDILSYFTWLFDSIPYLWFNGDMSAGKTKACSVHEQLGFNGFMAVGMTAPNLFRIIRDTRGMIIIDENENQGNINSSSDEDKLAREQIINSGYKKSGKTSRIERGQDGKPHRVSYPTFGPKVIGGINKISDTIRSRSYRILMIKTNNSEIANSVVTDSDPVWQDIRDKLYIIMLNHWAEILDLIDRREASNKHKFEDGTELTLIGRDWEKAEPILTIGLWLSNYAKDNGALIEEIWDFLRYQKEKEEEPTLDTLDISIIHTVEEKFIKDGPHIQLREISGLVALEEGIDTGSPKFNLTRYSKKIKDRLEKLGLVKEFKRGTDNILYFETAGNLIEATKTRYKMNVTVVNNYDNSGNYDNYDNLGNYDNLSNTEKLAIIQNKLSQLSKIIVESKEEDSEKMRIVRQKLSRIIEIIVDVTGVTRITEKNSDEHSEPNIEDIKKELKETLSLSGGIMSIKIFYDLIKERFAELPEAEANKIFKNLTESGEFNFDFNSQIVTLEDPRK